MSFQRAAVSDSEKIRTEQSRRAASNSVLRVRSRELLRGGTQMLIEHEGREYQLRVTGSGKLILTA